MANENLKTALIVDQALINVSLLEGLPLPLVDWLVNLQQTVQDIADKSNEAAAGAYESQTASDGQSEVIVNINQSVEDQQNLVAELSREVNNNSRRITNVQESNSQVEQRLSEVETKAETNRLNIESQGLEIDAIKVDYVSKSETVEQDIASPINVATSYSVDGVKVVGMQQVGFSATTGTDYKGTFNADKTYTVSSAYSQAEITTMANDLTLARKSIAALLKVMRSHGLTD